MGRSPASQAVPEGRIRLCSRRDSEAIYQIINEAAKAYKRGVPPHVYHEPQMPMDELMRERERITFLAYEENGSILGVIGYEHVKDVTLIRHAYVLPGVQRKGIGSLLLKHVEAAIAESGRPRRVIIGTYSGAEWAISFYEKHGYSKSGNPQQILTQYYNIPEVQRLNSLTLEKTLS